MGFQDRQDAICWRLHLTSSPEEVYEALTSDSGRAMFWAESAIEKDGVISFVFPNGFHWEGKVLERELNTRFVIEYIGGSRVTFELQPDGAGGTDLDLTDEGVWQDERVEVIAGWVTVLMALKAAVDFGVDLRNHDPERTWDQSYVEN